MGLACTPHAEVIGIFWDHSDLHFLRPAHNVYKSMPSKGSKRTPNDFMSTISHAWKKKVRLEKKKSCEWPEVISLEKQGRKALAGYQLPQTRRRQHFQERKQTAPGDSQVTESTHGGGLVKTAVTVMPKLSDR